MCSDLWQPAVCQGVPSVHLPARRGSGRTQDTLCLAVAHADDFCPGQPLSPSASSAIAWLHISHSAVTNGQHVWTSTHTHVEVQALAGATGRLQAALTADPATAQQSGRLDTAVYFLEAVISSVADAHLGNGAARCPPGV